MPDVLLTHFNRQQEMDYHLAFINTIPLMYHLIPIEDVVPDVFYLVVIYNCCAVSRKYM